MTSTFATNNWFNTGSQDNSSIWDSIFDSFNESLYKAFYDTFINPMYDLFEQRFASLWHIAVIIMIVKVIIGLIGNILSLIVWNKGKESRKMSCSTYFKILAASDILTVLSIMITFEIPHLFDITETNYCSILGYVQNFLTPLAPQLSAWIIVNITLERMLSLCFPFRFRKQGFRRRAWLSSIGIVLLLLGLNYEQYICSSYVLDNAFGFPMCICADGNTEVLGKISMVWFLCILPLVLMTFGNIVIATRLFIMSRSKLISSSRRQSRQRTFTKMCISATSLHCVSVLPVTIMTYYSDGLFDSENVNNLYEIYDVINILAALLSMSLAHFVLNNSLNFLIYCFSGTKFRSDLKDIALKCICKSGTGNSPRQSRSSTSSSNL